MRIIQRYIGRSVLVTFLITLSVLTGILCLGNLLKIADLILKGMDPWLILQFFGFLLVGLLEYAIPISILTATILVFGRLSADNEITGMRASGIGLLHITTPVFVFGFILMLICLYLQNTVIPNYSFATRKLKARIGLQDPDALLQPGEIIEFPGYTINFDRKEDGILYKVQINQYENKELASAIFARRAKIELDKEREGFTLKLYDGTVEEITDRQNPQIRTTTTFGVFHYPISLKALYEKSRVLDQDKRKKDMTRGELIRQRKEYPDQIAENKRELEAIGKDREETARQERILLEEAELFIRDRGRRLFWESYLSGEEAHAVVLKRLLPGAPGTPPPRPDLTRNKTREEWDSLLERIAGMDQKLSGLRRAREGLLAEQREIRGEVSAYTTELHKRLSLAAACLSLVFVSIPLAIKAHRSEKTIGMAFSLALTFIYYIFIAYADAVAADYRLFPYLIVWVPNILFIVFGTLWMIKFTRI
ncbi:MAG: LptF/LptG family permease [PVC group bacterium]